MTHPCPGCAAPVASNPRYPLAFCRACVTDAATDSAGVPIDIAEDMRMALAYRIAGGDWVPAATILCRIRGQKAQVNQARFGGIVAEPFDGAAPARAGVVAL